MSLPKVPAATSTWLAAWRLATSTVCRTERTGEGMDSPFAARVGVGGYWFEHGRNLAGPLEARKTEPSTTGASVHGRRRNAGTLAARQGDRGARTRNLCGSGVAKTTRRRGACSQAQRLNRLDSIMV